MELKEYIKQYIRELLDEESSSGDVGAYSTPFAFAKKGQKKNKATATAEREGMKLAKKPTKSKVVDYKKIWKESDYDKASPYTAASEYGKESGYTKASPSSNPSLYLSEKEKNMKESLMNMIKQELLNEVTYSKFKNEVKYRTKNEQLHKAIREVKRKLMEIDRIVEYTSRMKQELSEGEEGIKYWKATEKNVGQIAEMMTQLNNKIKNLNQ